MGRPVDKARETFKNDPLNPDPEKHAAPRKNRIAWAILAPAHWGSKRTACTRYRNWSTVMWWPKKSSQSSLEHGTRITYSRACLSFQDVKIHPMKWSADQNWKTLSDLSGWGPSHGIPSKIHPIYPHIQCIICLLPKNSTYPKVSQGVPRCPKGKVCLPSHSCPKADRMTRSIRAWSMKNMNKRSESSESSDGTPGGRPPKKELVLKWLDSPHMSAP